MLDDFVESREEMEAILQESALGFLGMSMDGRPYVVPLNYAYVDGKILFHCALEGTKLDFLSSNPRICFTVAKQPATEVLRHGKGDPCHMDCESVICYGRARIIEDAEERQTVLNAFNRSFRPNAEQITLEEVAGCGAVEITVSEMTGRRECNRELTCWRYRFTQ
jgi:nitroimidazol reductase NimA-like FMN-containing flavoprotein (pyridoxamine 5'-phosphate oxidase superfamily)